MKRHAPAIARNSAAISDVLAKELPDSGTVLEIAAGSGEHAVYFAREFPKLTWLPSDVDIEALESIQAWSLEAGLGNILPPVRIDASVRDWPVEQVDAIFCCNMIHISPWAATEGLFGGAEQVLTKGQPLIVYGPFLEEAVETAPSNLAFDQNLKDRNTAWGLRSVSALDSLAVGHGFDRTNRVEMPANNLTLTYRRV